MLPCQGAELGSVGARVKSRPWSVGGGEGRGDGRTQSGKERHAAWGWLYPHSSDPCPPAHLSSCKWSSVLCNQGFAGTRPSVAAPICPHSLCTQPLNRHFSNSQGTQVFWGRGWGGGYLKCRFQASRCGVGQEINILDYVLDATADFLV